MMCTLYASNIGRDLNSGFVICVHSTTEICYGLEIKEVAYTDNITLTEKLTKEAWQLIRI